MSKKGILVLVFLLSLSLTTFTFAGSGKKDDVIGVSFIEYPKTMVGGELVHGRVQFTNYTNLVRVFDFWIHVTTPKGGTDLHLLAPYLIEPYAEKIAVLDVISPFYAELGNYIIQGKVGQYWAISPYEVWDDDVITIEYVERNPKVGNSKFKNCFNNWSFILHDDI